MMVDGYDPVNLFRMLPKLELEFEPDLAHLDELLDDDELFKLLKADLLRRYPHSAKLGCHSRRGDPRDAGGQETLRMELRACPEHFVSDSIILRQFCCLYLQSAPNDTTLIRWANLIGPKMALGRTQEAKATHRAAYQRLAEVAKASIKQAEQVRSMLEDLPSAPKISEEISHFAGHLERAVWQTHLRVFEGEQLSAGQKLLSIFEEHKAIRYAGARPASKPSLGGRCGSLRWRGAS